MAESWLRLSGAGAAEEPGSEGGLEEPDALDDSLTSLQWLQEFSILNAKAPALPSGGTDPHGYHQVPGSAAPGSPLAADPEIPAFPGEEYYVPDTRLCRNVLFLMQPRRLKHMLC